ncbi:MAG: hypothetical protein AMS18_07560 [Gemmatimonas sp. SG8_17]|nr:MAG: hypothetical protein AMS18_07560 [Gemmatimonas sp. SG8_17]
MRSIRKSVVSVLGWAAFTACDTPGVTLIEPDQSSVPDSVKFVVSLADSALAAALGWSDGVPNAEIFLHRATEQFRFTELHTDETGTVGTTDLIPGLYRVAALRTLTVDEAAAVGSVVRAFGNGFKTNIGRSGTVSIELRSDQPGSLVFSELHAVSQLSIGPYQWHQFFELYNNGDTTVYLDGMYWGRAFHLYRDYPPYPCSATEAWRNDSLGVWAIFFHQFPGSGTDYPVVPGQVVVVALDAVDHSVVSPVFPNLSQADFELSGTADVDNPDVPNMPAVGLRAWFRDHGLDIHAGQIYFLSLPLDLATLPRARPEFSGEDWIRFPREALLDVVWTSARGVSPDQLALPCDVAVYPLLDGLEGGFAPQWNDSTIALHRRILRAGPNGPVLQDLNTSFVDLVTGMRSPGRIEY